MRRRVRLAGVWQQARHTERIRVPVSGWSMVPLLRDGDILEVDLRATWLGVGDLVVFRSAGEVVVHRVVAIRGGAKGAAGKTVELVTKGDRLWWCDRPIALEQTLGKVTAVHSTRGAIRLDTPAAAVFGHGVALLSLGQARVWRGLSWARMRAAGDRRGLPVRVLRRLCRIAGSLPLQAVLHAGARLLAARIPAPADGLRRSDAGGER